MAAVAGTTLTVSVPPPRGGAIPLVRHDDSWRFLRGRAAPQADWLTAPDTALTADWEAAAGGFGYGDPGIAGETTTLDDMRHHYTTLAIRREFELSEPLDPAWRLWLRVDFDDGFVAFLDGVELARVNVESPAGQPADPEATASHHHEASCCDDPTHPAGRFELGSAANRLPPGRHVLALQGVNESKGSSDFHLIADLTAEPPATVTVGPLLTLSRIPTVTLVGTNTHPDAVAVFVNGAEADFTPGEARWTREQSLTPGFNRIVVESRDANGLALDAAHVDVVYAGRETVVSGPLEADTTWTPALGVVRINEPLRLAAGRKLTLEPGTVALFGPAGSLVAENARVEAAGVAGHPVLLLPAAGGGSWEGVRVSGTEGSLTLRHTELVAAPVEIHDGATGLFADSILRDLPHTTTPIVSSDHAASVTLRRCCLARYHEINLQYTPTLIEDCLMQEYGDSSSDGIDLDHAPAGSLIRRCTLRHGREENSDAIDLGDGSRGVTIADCWLYDFSDKGVSIGEHSLGIVVTNCLIHDTGIGVEIKDHSTAGLYQNTIADCDLGLRLRIKYEDEGGHLTNALHNILWGFDETIRRLDDSTVVITHSDLEGGWPGEGNLAADPRFRDAARGDYRLAPDSPLRTAGLDGRPLGARLPVGAALAPTFPRLAASAGPDGLRLRFAADPDRAYRLESADTLGGAWRLRERFPALPWPRTVEWRAAFPAHPRFFRLVTEAVR
jgi:hypothetical protein